jgi:hypothetical protein
MLFERIADVGEQGQVAGAFDGLTHFALELEAGAGQPPGQDFTLLVEQFEQKVGVFVVDVLDPGLLEAAIFFAVFVAAADRFVLKAHVQGGLVVGFRRGFGLAFFADQSVAFALVVVNGVFVEGHHQKPQHALVAQVLGVQHGVGGARCLILKQMVEPGVLSLNGIGQFFQPQMFLVNHLSPVCHEERAKFVDGILYLLFR